MEADTLHALPRTEAESAAERLQKETGKEVEILPEESGLFTVRLKPLLKAGSYSLDGSPVDPEAALVNDLTKALSELAIEGADQDTISMLNHAARLSPDDAQSPISTTRLFAGAVAVGQSSKRERSYPVALAAAIARDAELSRIYQTILGLFTTEPAEMALDRLRSQWFSPNVQRILKAATAERADWPLSDAIVRTLIKFPAGLARGRIPMDRIAAALESQLGGSPDAGKKPSVMDEIHAALAAREIATTETVRALLLRAAAYRGKDELGVFHVLFALLDFGASDQRHFTDPSVMLRGSMTAVPTPSITPLAPDQAPDPSNPLRLNQSMDSLLQRALSKQKRIFRNPALGTKGLVAGLLTTPRIEFEDLTLFHRYQLDEVPTRFHGVIQEQLKDDAALKEQWRRALAFETVSPPKLNTDQPGIGPPQDKLGVTNDAVAIANVAAGQSTSLPLALGIFGDWGAGKTFFMRLIQEQIAGIVKSAAKDDGFEHAIVQIHFNAWHYAETNLWASLVGHIFDELDRWMTRSQGGGDPTAADDILKRLTTSRQLTIEAATTLVQRRKEHERAGAVLADAQDTLAKAEKDAAHAPVTAWSAVIDAVRYEIKSDEELDRELGGIQVALNLPGLLENKAELTAALDELKRSASAGATSLAALRSTIGTRRTVVAAIVALAGVPFILFVLQQGLARWQPEFAEVGRGFEALGGLLAMLAVLARSFAARAKGLADKLANLRKSVDAKITSATKAEQDSVAAAAAEVAKSTADVESAKMLVQATGEQVAAAQREYAEETGALRIRRFVRARAGAEGYGKHLGLVSTIRKDFEQLESLMLKRSEDPPEHLEQARQHYAARVEALIKQAGSALEDEEKIQLRKSAESLRDAGMTEAMAFRRIVLYIDDLDRCEANKVVEVLQAVNMLLSFQLFVVMVAVDARWLSRSLETQYPDFFGSQWDGDEGNTDGKDRAAKSSRDRTIERASAADYLEKIFQIPYWVPEMNPKASAALVGDLVSADRIGKKEEYVPPPSPPPVDSQANEKTPRPGEDDQPDSEDVPSRALGLTQDEISTLTALSPFLGCSPRRARRFVNVYRVAKASLSPGEIRRLENSEHRALATQLAIATGAPNAFGLWVAACQSSDDNSILDRVRSLETGVEERGNIEGALQKFRAMPSEGNDVLKKLASQADRAARFSFALPPRSS